jgi:rhodanese-related sulfurtransferase
MTTTLKDMLADARQSVAALSVPQARDAVDHATVAVILDIREPDEWARGHLPGAANIPRGWLELRADPASPIAEAALAASQDGTVLVYCSRAPGVRSLLAAATLRELGYPHAAVLEGGLEEWAAAGLPVETAPGDG